MVHMTAVFFQYATAGRGSFFSSPPCGGRRAISPLRLPPYSASLISPFSHNKNRRIMTRGWLVDNKVPFENYQKKYPCKRKTLWKEKGCFSFKKSLFTDSRLTSWESFFFNPPKRQHACGEKEMRGFPEENKISPFPRPMNVLPQRSYRPVFIFFPSKKTRRRSVWNFAPLSSSCSEEVSSLKKFASTGPLFLLLCL